MPSRFWNQERYQELLLALQNVHPRINWTAVADQMTETSVAGIKQHLLALRHLKKEGGLSAATKSAIKPKATAPSKVSKSTKVKKTQPKDKKGDGSDDVGELLSASTK